MEIRRTPRLEAIQPAPKSSFVLRSFRVRRLDFNWHYHPEIELTLIVAGRGLRYVGHSIEPYSSGDLCLLGPNLPHTWVTSRPIESLVIQFQPDSFQGAFASWREMDSVRILFERAERGLLLEGRLREEIGQRMIELGALPEGDPFRLLRLVEIFVRMGLHPPRIYLSAASAVYSMRPEVGRRIQRVVSYVEQNFAGALSHAQAASVARMAPTAFSRFFRKHVGKTFEDYVNEVRIGQVCAELQQTDEPITDIALQCGFQNLANFNRRFRERLQMTPRAYRAAGMESAT